MGHDMLEGLHMGVDRTQEDEQIKSLQPKKQELGLAHEASKKRACRTVKHQHGIVDRAPQPDRNRPHGVPGCHRQGEGREEGQGVEKDKTKYAVPARFSSSSTIIIASSSLPPPPPYPTTQPPKPWPWPMDTLDTSVGSPPVFPAAACAGARCTCSACAIGATTPTAPKPALNPGSENALPSLPYGGGTGTGAYALPLRVCAGSCGCGGRQPPAAAPVLFGDVGSALSSLDAGLGLSAASSVPADAAVDGGEAGGDGYGAPLDEVVVVVVVEVLMGVRIGLDGRARRRALRRGRRWWASAAGVRAGARRTTKTRRMRATASRPTDWARRVMKEAFLFSCLPANPFFRRADDARAGHAVQEATYAYVGWVFTQHFCNRLGPAYLALRNTLDAANPSHTEALNDIKRRFREETFTRENIMDVVAAHPALARLLDVNFAMTHYPYAAGGELVAAHGCGGRRGEQGEAALNCEALATASCQGSPAEIFPRAVHHGQQPACVRRWLEPLPDDSLPALKIQSCGREPRRERAREQEEQGARADVIVDVSMFDPLACPPRAHERNPERAAQRRLSLLSTPPPAPDPYYAAEPALHSAPLPRLPPLPPTVSPMKPKEIHRTATFACVGNGVVWDLKDPSTPYSPGTRSSKLDEITSLAWNRQVQYVLASSSSSGQTVVWDLRNKREVVALAYGAAMQGLNIMGAGGKRGMSDVAWHPDNATRLVTSSEDDASPVVMVWDLRNARALEKILTGHEKGILSLSWCKQDADLLLSCGKDNCALYWNPQTAEIIGETTNEPSDDQLTAPTPKTDGSDVFDVPGFSRTTQATLSLRQPPKWLRRPITSSLGYDGFLVSVSNLPSAQGKNQSSVVHLHKITPGCFASQLLLYAGLKSAADEQALRAFAQGKSAEAAARAGHDAASWKTLASLFKASEIAARVVEAVERIRATATPTHAPADVLDEESKVHEPIVSFAEPEAEQEQECDRTPSEQGTSVASDYTEVTKAVDRESTTTAPSLFGDDIGGTPQSDAEADFFSTMGTTRNTITFKFPTKTTHTTHPSRPRNMFRIYPSEESEFDHLVTKSLVLGDFESAVTLCLSAERVTQRFYSVHSRHFEKRTINLPYLCLFQSIVTEDLDDIVQNADLQEWQEIFVVLCTFAKPGEFANLAEQLSQRLEFNASMMKSAEALGAEELRKNATLTYLAAGRLEKVVNIWTEEMAEEEGRLLDGADEKSSLRYSAHAHALQIFMEKVTIFRSANNYTDADLKVTPDPSAVRTYKQSNLYERYFEYHGNCLLLIS
ncbi:hypothetical protein DFH11DRAFT_1543420 [Phellopilus nigrolimitatus]|nr:hypothetical protein DFH11DRAFT_1543420 [Phellopilus nigrolimitatus]